jgi:hypothetical protein
VFGSASILTMLAVIALNAAAPAQAVHTSMGERSIRMSDQRRLQADLDSRYEQQAGGVPAAWTDTSNGFYGTFSLSDDEYRIWYDKYGNYIATMVRGTWNDIPLVVKMSLDKGNYRLRNVKEFWEASDPEGKQGYCLEFDDGNGNRSRIWSDKKGRLSGKPPKSVFSQR